MLTISPNGGMCNRLMALHSAIALAKASKQSLRVMWYCTGEFCIPFHEVFERPVEIRRYRSFDRQREGRLFEFMYRYLRWPFIRPDFTVLEMEAMLAAGHDFEAVAAEGDVYLESRNLFFGTDVPFYPFSPIDPIRRRIERITRDFEKTVGVHLRRTDHNPSILYSPTALFEERMQELIDADPAVDFFVSSDSSEEIERLKTRFPGKIRTSNPASLKRDEKAGIEAAVVDLFALAATTRILGSYSSTFSEVAGKLGRIETEFMLSGSPLAAEG